MGKNLSVLVFDVKKCFLVPNFLTISYMEKILTQHFHDFFQVEEFEDIKSGYRIHFHFDANPYFDNTTLTKEFCLGAASGPSSNSTPINWKEGKDLLKLMQFKQQSTKRKRHLEYKTFFDWFIDNNDPVNDEIAEVCPLFFFQNNH